MQVKMQKWSSGLVVGLVFTALVIGGCAKGSKSVSDSVSGPSAATFQPTGTIEGVVRDAVTLQPIVNAIVSIGLAIGVTDAQGQYILANVPATTDALNGTVSGHYDMTVDLRNVTSPVAMNVPTTTPRYPDFRYSTVVVNFTSLNDSSPCPNSSGTGAPNTNVTQNCGTNATNHDTPVGGLVANAGADIDVGKLNANIKGSVAGGCTNPSDRDYYVLKAGYVVNLFSNSTGSGSGNSSTGSGRLVATTKTGDGTTVPLGQFEFDNIEAGQSFKIQVMDNAANPTVGVGLNQNITGSIPFAAVTSPADGQTDTTYLAASNAIHVCRVDSHGPTIIAVSPEPGSDQTAGATTVTLTFSSPVDTTRPQASTDPSNKVGLISSGKLQVQFDGIKGTGVPFTASWNAAGDQLTVALTTGTSSYYHVLLDPTILIDVNKMPSDHGMCPSQVTSWGNPSGTVGNGTTNCVVYFTTKGGATPGTPVLTLMNGASLDQAGSTTAILDWPPVSGAKTYNIYCTTWEHFFNDTYQPGQTVFMSSVTNSDKALPLVTFLESNQVGLVYGCFVRGVNSDGVEGPNSNIVTARDAVGPGMIGGSFVVTSTVSGNVAEVRVSFNEPLDEASAETPGNYVFSNDTGTKPTTTGAILCSGAGVPVASCTGANMVVLTITQTQTPVTLQDNAGDLLTVSGVKDVNLNTIKLSGDVYHLSTGVVD